MTASKDKKGKGKNEQFYIRSIMTRFSIYDIMSPDMISAPIRVRPEGGQFLRRIVRIRRKGAFAMLFTTQNTLRLYSEYRTSQPWSEIQGFFVVNSEQTDSNPIVRGAGRGPGQKR